MNMLSEIKKKGLVVAILLLPSLCVCAQSDSVANNHQRLWRKTEHSLLVGGGEANVLDTYLSPYSYKGENARVQLETVRPTKLMQGRVVRRTLFEMNGAVMANRPGNVDAYAFGLRYGFGMSNKLATWRRLSIEAGPELSAYLGAVYVDRAGNNPANVHADMTLNATVHAVYTFSVKRREWKAAAGMSVPMLGAAFSMNYGQSYYEAFELRNYDKNVVFANLLNIPSLCCRLTLSIPVGRHESAFLFGYAGQINQSRLNNLKYHSYTHDFMVGYSKTLYRK